MLNMGGHLALMSRYQDEWLRSDTYRKLESDAFESSKAARFLRLCYKEWEKMPLSGTGIVEDHACLILEPHKLTSQYCSFTDSVKLTLLWIEPKYRRQGLGKKIVFKLADIATRSECVLIAVSNPVDFPKNFSAKDVLENDKKPTCESQIEYIKYGYRKRQRITNALFKEAGFQNIDLSDSMGSPKRCRIKDTWALVPENYSSHLDWDEKGLSARLVK